MSLSRVLIRTTQKQRVLKITQMNIMNDVRSSSYGTLIGEVRRACLMPHVPFRSYSSGRPLRNSHAAKEQISIKIASTSRKRPKRIIVAVTGATGAPLAVKLLENLRELGIETHLILSTW
jgi:hypothetical protein